jgi:hypothetical protein
MEVILSTHKGAPQNRSNTKETKGQSGLALMVEPWAWTNFFIGILSCFLHNQGIVSEIEMAINSFLRRTTEYSGLCGKRIHIIEYPPVRLCTYGVPLSPEWLYRLIFDYSDRLLLLFRHLFVIQNAIRIMIQSDIAGAKRLLSDFYGTLVRIGCRGMGGWFKWGVTMPIENGSGGSGSPDSEHFRH